MLPSSSLVLFVALSVTSVASLSSKIVVTAGVSSNVKFSKLPTSPALSSTADTIFADTESVSLYLSSPLPSSLSLVTACAVESPVKSPASIVITTPLSSVTVTSFTALFAIVAV